MHVCVHVCVHVRVHVCVYVRIHTIHPSSNQKTLTQADKEGLITDLYDLSFLATMWFSLSVYVCVCVLVCVCACCSVFVNVCMCVSLTQTLFYSPNPLCPSPLLSRPPKPPIVSSPPLHCLSWGWRDEQPVKARCWCRKLSPGRFIIQAVVKNKENLKRGLRMCSLPTLNLEKWDCNSGKSIREQITCITTIHFFPFNWKQIHTLFN